MDDVYECSNGNTEIPAAKKIIYRFDKWIEALVKNGIDTETAIKQFINAPGDSHNDSIVICDDISCGVVPPDPVMRAWREAVGRSLAALSQQSCEVIRLFCGIPSRLK